VVLSASADPDDIKKSYILGASAYLLKPSAFEELQRLLKVLLDFWMACEVPEVDLAGKRVRTESRGKLGARFGDKVGQ
jgi:DNA-binding NarL/FixJ family response regulator